MNQPVEIDWSKNDYMMDIESLDSCTTRIETIFWPFNDHTPLARPKKGIFDNNQFTINPFW